MNKVFGIQSLHDNYIWAIHDQDHKHIVIVDPGESEPVLMYLRSQNLVLDAILLTHHHGDHTSGVRGLLQQFPNIPVYSSVKDKVTGVTQFVKEGDKIDLEKQNVTLEILEIPGHTLGHIAYFGNNLLFCGDTLFSVGCGKIFEGTAQQMHNSLEKLKKLPSSTQMYCGHEYTLNNIKFAQAVDPNNQALEARRQAVLALREKDQPSLPVPMSLELETNPFLRCNETNIALAIEIFSGEKFSNESDVFAYLRKWKNQF